MKNANSRPPSPRSKIISKPESRRSNATRTAETQGKLIAAARAIFVRDGFAAAATDEIVQAAGVTRGALYHHFNSKEWLFRAVIEQEAQDIAAMIAQSDTQSAHPADAILHGADAYFDAMTVPGRSLLMLIEGPSALGWPAMNEIDRSAGGGELRAGLHHMLNDRADPETVSALAQILSAAFDRAAIEINQGKSAEPYQRAINLLLRGLA